MCLPIKKKKARTPKATKDLYLSLILDAILTDMEGDVETRYAQIWSSSFIMSVLLAKMVLDSSIISINSNLKMKVS